MGRLDFPILYRRHRSGAVAKGEPKGARKASIADACGEIDIAQDAAPFCRAARSRSRPRQSGRRYQIIVNLERNFALANLFRLRGGRISNQVYGMWVRRA